MRDPQGARRALYLLVGVVVVASITVYIAWDALFPPEEEALPSALAPQPEPEAVPEETPPPPQEARPLAITGQVLRRAPDGPAGIAGLRLVCGEETAETDETGSFRFPEAVRPRLSGLIVLRGGQEIASWSGLVTGEVGPRGDDVGSGPGDLGPAGGEPGAPGGTASPADPEGDGAEPALEDPGSPLPERPLRIRWTVNLLDPESPSPDPSGPWIACGRVLCEDWGAQVRIQVSGTTRLPAGAQLATSLYFEGFRILGAAESAEAEDGSFRAVMSSLPGFNFYSGTYEVHVAYSAVLQRADRIEEWRRDRPETDWYALDVPLSVPVFLGSSSEALEEDREVEIYYDRVLGEVRRLERRLKSQVEEVLDLARGWNPAVLRQLMDAARFVELAEGGQSWDPDLLARRQEARAGWYSDRLVEGGVFQEARWREFLDAEWRPSVAVLQEEHETRVQEKYPEAGARLGALLRALLAESYALSSFVVYPPDLPRHPNDFYPDEERAGDLLRLEGILQDNYRELQRFRRLTPSR